MKFTELIPEKPKLDRKELNQIEPGNKVPLTEYKQIGQWCDVCEDVEMHAYSIKYKKIRCLKCKTTKQLK